MSIALRQRIRGLFQPALFHGHHLRQNFFEGWYYKFIDAGEQRAWAVIPGIFLGPGGKGSHAFIQVFDGTKGVSWYHRFPAEAFSASRERFDLRIQKNHFTASSLLLDLDSEGQRLRGTLDFSPATPWPWRPWAPGIMGPFSFTPFMECSHGIVSLDHPVSGALESGDARMDFTGGRGYIEKDWGRSFPRAWVWMQSNHFENPGVSLTASIARIPWMKTAFRGFIVGLLVGGKLYRFATYLGSRTKILGVDDQKVAWVLENRDLRLEIEASRNGGGLLHAPMRPDDAGAAETMSPRVLESLTAVVHVRLTRRRSKEILFIGTGKHAGLEVGGEIHEILG
jgi:hypothetical protein